MKFFKPKILVSSCLWFAACRYNGQKLASPVLEKLKEFVDVLDVCPEVEIWLGVPRLPIHLEYKNKEVVLIQTSTEKNVANEMKSFSQKFCQTLKDVDGAILKSKSPSCGIVNVRMEGTSKSDNPFKWRGIFTHYLLEKYPFLAIEDEGRLLNYEIREIFFTKIFCKANFRELKKRKNIKELIEFHTSHKYLFMRYHQKDLTILGRIIAKHDKTNSEKLFEEYESGLLELFTHNPNKVKAKNVLNHMYGYFKNKLSNEEKAFFFGSLDMYLDERIPFSNLIMIIKIRALNYKEEYILNQKILSPFPIDLLDLADSGKKKLH